MTKCHRTGVIIGLLSCVLLTAGIGSAVQPQERGDVVAAAQAGVAQFLAKIPVGSEALYGFTDRSEFGSVGLGTPIAVLTIVPDSIKDGVEIGREYLVPVNEWRVPVTVNGEMRALLTVSKVEGNWTAVDFGAAGLAIELHRFMTVRAAEMSGRPLQLLRLYQLHCDFAVVGDTAPAVTTAAIYPLRSAAMMLERNAQTVESVYSIEKLLPVIREDFRREAANEQ